MKTERRKELQTNTLADWLGKRLERLLPYSRLIAAAIVAASVLVILFVYLSSQSAAREEEAWNRYFAAIANNKPEQLMQVAEEFQGEPVSASARLIVAESQLAQGIDALFRDRSLGQQELGKAAQQFQTVLEQSKDDLLLQRATYGLARAKESLNELPAAQAQYERLAQDWPDGALAKLAQRRVKDLKNRSTKEFYDWFARQDPKPPLQGEPGATGVKPDFDPASLPSEPDIKPDTAEKFGATGNGKQPVAAPPNDAQSVAVDPGAAPAAPDGTPSTPSAPIGEPRADTATPPP